MSNSYDLGDLIRLSATFTDAAGAAADPTEVTIRVRRYANGAYEAESDLAVVHDGLGAYHADVAPSLAGPYRYRVEGTGTVQQAAEGTFVVRPSSF